jgi:hypothetical protein
MTKRESIGNEVTNLTIILKWRSISGSLSITVGISIIWRIINNGGQKRNVNMAEET